ncbi:MAG: response regulator [Candidatus Aureabacteria bacterium]|nr:response regulator [Candidatus Auribacterota bacterium]
MKRVLIVDDDPFIRTVVRDKLKQEDLFIVEASNGIEAFHKMIDQFFDLVILDINMPKMNGIETIRALKKVNVHIPIVVISGIKNKEILRSAITEGATTYMKKPFEPATLVNVVKQVLSETDGKVPFYFLDEKKVDFIVQSAPAVNLEEDEPAYTEQDVATKVIVLGASTGGPKILQFLVRHFSKMIKAAMVIVQHIPFTYTESLITHLKNASVLHLKEAEANEVMRNGVIYVARGGFHMVFQRNDSGKPSIVFDDSPPIFSMKPAVNPTMLSAAEVFKDKSLGIILTGMGVDGTEGAKAIKRAGGKIIAQNEESCEVYGMPRSVVELKIADEVLSPESIIHSIVEWAT